MRLLIASDAWVPQVNGVVRTLGRVQKELTALGHAVEWREYPMGHSVCMEEVADLQAWLLKVLA